MTIVKDGFPFITNHINVFNRLTVPWQWICVEGTSRAVRDTSWCQEMPARLSIDGTTEYLAALAKDHPRVFHIKQASWEGKTAMCNAALNHVKPGLLWQVDADEIWTSNQIETVYEAFSRNPQHTWAHFYCRYFLGPNIVITSRDTYGNRAGEWARVWRIPEDVSGLYWVKHEPPVLYSPVMDYWHGNVVTREQTEAMGLVFSHYAYTTEQQVAWKETFYGYSGALAQWRRLQAHKHFPVRASDFLAWIKDDTMCDRLYKV